jgi:hypothetical protein
MKTKIFTPFFLLLISSFLLIGGGEVNAQNFSGFNAWKTLIEYEGQRFLMYNVFNINEENSAKLKLTKSIQEIDDDEGFMIVFTSYQYGDNSGVVITAFNSQNHVNSNFGFININLNQSELMSLNQAILNQVEDVIVNDVHHLLKFNDRITVDVHCTNQSQSTGEKYYDIILWIDGHTRHSFTPAKWNRALKKHQSFLQTAFLD